MFVTQLFLGVSKPLFLRVSNSCFMFFKVGMFHAPGKKSVGDFSLNTPAVFSMCFSDVTMYFMGIWSKRSVVQVFQKCV